MSIQTNDDEKWRISKHNSSWCVSDLTPVALPEEIRKEIDREVKAGNIPPKLKGKEKTLVTFACGLKDGRRLLPVENACLYCFLPAERARWGFPFLMNTDMVPTGPRDDVRPDLKLNHQLSRIAGEEFCKWINSLLKCGKYDYDSIFALIPDIGECIERTEIPAVKDFLREFKLGFESGITDLQIPDSAGTLMPISQVWYDAMDLIGGMGYSFWKKYVCAEKSAHKSLLESPSFKKFLKRYKNELAIREYGVEDLKTLCEESDQLREWLANPMANAKFLKFLVDQEALGEFKGVPIFLDNHKHVGLASGMYYYGEAIRLAEKLLPSFTECFSYLSCGADCVRAAGDALKNAFKTFQPRALIESEILSVQNRASSLKLLADVKVARDLFAFIAHYKTFSYTRWVTYGWGRRRQETVTEEYFPKAFLETFPVVLKDGTILDSFSSQEYSVFCPPEGPEAEKLWRERWIEDGWMKCISRGYFEGVDGETVKQLFLEKQLIRKSDHRGILAGVLDKFKDQIVARMKERNSDLGVYDFLVVCLENRCVNLDWIKETVTAWPVLDSQGRLVSHLGGKMYFSSPDLLGWTQCDWFKGSPFVVLHESYADKESLFKLLGALPYQDNLQFGELFVAVISHLNLETAEQVIAFHSLMRGKMNLLNDLQKNLLRNTPVLALGESQPKMLDSEMYLPPSNIDIADEITRGEIQVKILDPRLCPDKQSIQYWEQLGVRKFDEITHVAEILRTFLHLQDEVCSRQGGVYDEAFLKRHHAIVGTLAAGNMVTLLSEAKHDSLLGRLKVLTKGGLLEDPKILRFPSAYKPECDFEPYWPGEAYVTDEYLSLPGAKDFLLALGMEETFRQSDVALLVHPGCCKYFWTVYLPLHRLDWNSIKPWLKSSCPCVLDQKQIVRKPQDLYDPTLMSYVQTLTDGTSKSPYLEGVDKELLTEIGLRTSLSVSDSLQFLLSNPPNKMRGAVLQWISDSCDSAPQFLVEDYTRDSRALWFTGKGNGSRHITKLCAIRRKNSEQVRRFVNDEHVMNLKGLGVGKDDASWEKVEKALKWLGVQLLDDRYVEVVPDENVLNVRIVPEIASRMLAFIGERYEEDWASEFDDPYARLKEYQFYKCRGLVFQCKGNAWLKSEHGRFLVCEDTFFYVGDRADDWQSKYVYGYIVSALQKKFFPKYSIADLMETLDTNGGDIGVAKRLVERCRNLLATEEFSKRLLEVSESVWQAVQRLLESEKAEAMEKEEGIQNAGSLVVTHVEKACEPETEGLPCVPLDTNSHQDDKADSGREESTGVELKLGINQGHKVGNYDVDEDEFAQLTELFAGGLTGEGAADDTARRQDESKLACLRLFNYLENRGLEPTMDGHREAAYVVKKLYEKLGKSGPNIDINTGERLHVISAMGGVGYIPPKWWLKIVNNENGKNVICAVAGAKDENFILIRDAGDLTRHVADNAIPVKIRGVDADERVRIASEWFAHVDTKTTAAKIYALLKLRDKTVMNSAFAKGFCSDEMSEYEAMHSDDL